MGVKKMKTTETVKKQTRTKRKTAPKDKPSLISQGSRGDKQLYKRLFGALDKDAKGYIYKKQLTDAFNWCGIRKEDPRMENTTAALHEYEDNQKISPKEFTEIVKNNISLIDKAFQGNLIIPDFENFCEHINEIATKIIKDKKGKVADYIPQLGRVDPEHFGISICTVDGQRLSIGDTGVPYAVQSTCKPVNYCLALEENGEKIVHQHVGREPSGRGFNQLSLNNDGLPHNPMINSGAIMSTSLIKRHEAMADRFDYVKGKWGELAGNTTPGFNNAMYLSEKETADRNFALGYFMKEKKAFPDNTNLVQTLEFYFQCCSIELTADQHSTVAASLANAGICPMTDKRIFKPDTVKNCLSLMSSCGMYDFSGEFSFSVGVPAKSGVSGALMIVIPNVMGIAVWSPRLDELGNSVRGIDFCKELVKRFNFHVFDSLIQHTNKVDPRFKRNEEHAYGVDSLCWAASQGDLHEVQRIAATGLNLNEADYDGRTALHLATSEGQEDIVQFLLCKKVNANPVDRWGNTPLDDADKGKNKHVVSLLEESGGKRMKK